MIAWRMPTRLSTDFTKRFKCWSASRLGAPPRGVSSGVQSFPFGRYVIFYHALGDAIEIVRVLHGARDIESIFEGHARDFDPNSKRTAWNQKL